MIITTNWASWQAFLNMGGYALYVWGSVLITVAALAWEAVALRLGHRQALQHARDAARRQGQEAPL